MSSKEPHAESALYWCAISLMVCDRLPMDRAAHRLGLATKELRAMLKRRSRPLLDLPRIEPASGAVAADILQQIIHTYPPTRPVSLS